MGVCERERERALWRGVPPRGAGGVIGVVRLHGLQDAQRDGDGVCEGAAQPAGRAGVRTAACPR